MKSILILFSFILFISLSETPLYAQHNMQDEKPAELLSGIGSLHHAFTTSSAEAQKFFDQGLTLIYGFNHDEAVKSFRRAIELDPNFAMAYWGISFALGPNYNIDAEPEQKKQAYEALQKAVELSKNATEVERDFINALSKRYSSDPNADQKRLNVEFRVAMKELAAKYPDDPDAQTLYAESMMILKPWQLWNKDGTPAEGTPEIIEVLENVLKKYPDHPGANHYYIHTMEASPDPGRALNSARVLGGLVPAAGHLVHMPAHILFRVGDYEGSAVANVNAIKADDDYIQRTGSTGIYPTMYYNHNINFLSVARLFQGRYADALDASKRVEANIMPMAKEMAMVQSYAANPLLVMVAFRKWDSILAYPAPPEGLAVYSIFWHFARGMAYTGKSNLREAHLEMKLLKELNVPEDGIVGLTPAKLIRELALNFLHAKIEEAEGNTKVTIELLRQAAKNEDAVSYDEPPDWYPSVRWSLGGFLYRTGDYAGAETVFREDLKNYPHNGRGLFGLYNSLKAQNKSDEASKIEEAFKEAWKRADTELSMEEL